MPKTVLVTGGAGYIGSTICSALLDAGHTPIVLDSLVRGREEFVRGVPLYRGDIADADLLGNIMSENPNISCVIHCAALALVPESVARPYDYYANNVSGSLEMFRILTELGCKDFVFSSSASLYDTAPGFMVTEDSPVRPSSPYARSKLMVEMILEDMAQGLGLRGLTLRYFNPIGADPKMRSGRNADAGASQILDVLVAVADGSRPVFSITGTDWPTRDGTGIRDYIHVWDLAQAHVLAVERMDAIFPDGSGYETVNLGRGDGVTVRELVHTFEKVYGRAIAKEDAPPRPGDVAGAFVKGERAKELLGWSARLSLEDGIRHALEWAEIDAEASSEISEK